jgi:16S rRNA processing protein RimM
VDSSRVEWVELGRFGRPKGLKGWSHLESWTDPPAALFDYPHWQLRDAAGQRRRCEVAEVRAGPSGLEARLEGVVCRDGAQALVGLIIEVARAALPATAPGEHYQVDLLGFRVVNVEDIELGVIERFVDMPANAVMVVRGERERWLPVTRQHLLSIDTATRCVRVDWPEDF